jgi:hypothetical protein
VGPERVFEAASERFSTFQECHTERPARSAATVLTTQLSRLPFRWRHITRRWCCWLVETCKDVGSVVTALGCVSYGFSYYTRTFSFTKPTVVYLSTIRCSGSRLVYTPSPNAVSYLHCLRSYLLMKRQAK